MDEKWQELPTHLKLGAAEELAKNPKSLGAARTPDELLNYNEPYRPTTPAKNEWTPDKVKTLQDYVDAVNTYGGTTADIKTAFKAAYPEMEITDQALSTAISKTKNEGSVNKGVGHAIKFTDEHRRHLAHIEKQNVSTKEALNRMRKAFPDATFSDATIRQYYYQVGKARREKK